MESADRNAFRFFLVSLALVVFAYGVCVGKYRVFPYKVLSLASQGLRELRTKTPWYYQQVDGSHPTSMAPAPGAFQGVNLITRMAANQRMAAEIVDMDGNVLHEWNVNWFDVWPDAEHLPEHAIPKSIPGALVHGAVVLENGGIIFNFEHLGLVRLSKAGDVVWRFPYRTHHSVHRHDDGTLWVCGHKEQSTPDFDYPMRPVPFDEYTILQINEDGELLNEWSVTDILLENGYAGLLYLGDPLPSAHVRHDVLHLNDVEPFSTTAEEGFFKHGDVVVSLRNINAVFVFNLADRKIKFMSVGQCIWQHDPDFVDGDTITVFDNHKRTDADKNAYSRIVSLTVPSSKLEEILVGDASNPFYSDIMGKHQWLPNGNLLVTETMRGRAFEVDHHGEIVWQYVNYVDDGKTGIVVEAQRLPIEYTDVFQDSK